MAGKHPVLSLLLFVRNGSHFDLLDIIISLIAGVALVAIFLLWEHLLEKVLDRREKRNSIWTSPPVMKLSLWTRARGQVTGIIAIIFLNWCGFMCWTFWVQVCPAVLVHPVCTTMHIFSCTINTTSSSVLCKP